MIREITPRLHSSLNPPTHLAILTTPKMGYISRLTTFFGLVLLAHAYVSDLPNPIYHLTNISILSTAATQPTNTPSSTATRASPPRPPPR